MKYPKYEDGHIKKIDNIQEIKYISFKNIKEINEMIKNGWIYLTIETCELDFSVLLGKPSTKFPS